MSAWFIGALLVPGRLPEPCIIPPIAGMLVEEMVAPDIGSSRTGLMRRFPLGRRVSVCLNGLEVCSPPARKRITVSILAASRRPGDILWPHVRQTRDYPAVARSRCR